MFRAKKEAIPSASIMDLMSSLGYPTNAAGVCYGIALMAERARRCGEFDKFVERIKFLSLFHQENISALSILIKTAEEYYSTIAAGVDKTLGLDTRAEEIEKAIRASAKDGLLFNCIIDETKIPFTPELVAKLLSIKAFFWQVWAHYKPDDIQKFLELPGSTLDQIHDTYEIEKLIYDNESKDAKTSPLSKPINYPLFKSSEPGFEDVYLKLFLKAIQEAAILVTHPSESVGLTIGCQHHTMHLFYDKNKNNWQFTSHSQSISCQTIDEVIQKLRDIYGVLIKDINPTFKKGPQNAIPNLTIQLFSDNPPALLTKKLEDIVHVSLATACKSNNINTIDSSLSRPLGVAVRNARNDIVNAMVDVKELDINEKRSGTSLSQAILRGRVEIVDTLLNAGANPNVSPVTLSEALEKKNLEIIKSLVRAKVNGANTLFFTAVRKSDLELVNALLEAGIDPNTQSMGATPLFIAAQNGDAVCVATLLRYNANPNIPYIISHEQLIAYGVENKIESKINQFIGNNPSSVYSLKPYDVAQLLDFTAVIKNLENSNEQKQQVTPTINKEEKNQLPSSLIRKVSQLDYAVADFGSQLFNTQITHKIFSNKIEKELIKKSTSEKTILTDIELFKLNLFDSLISAASQPGFTIESIEAYKQLNALVSSYLKILHSYDIKMFGHPEQDKISMLTLLANTLKELSCKTNIDLKREAQHLMEVLQTIHAQTIESENPAMKAAHSKSPFFKASTESEFLKAISQTVNDLQFQDLKQASFKPSEQKQNINPSWPFKG